MSESFTVDGFREEICSTAYFTALCIQSGLYRPFLGIKTVGKLYYFRRDFLGWFNYIAFLF